MSGGSGEWANLRVLRASAMFEVVDDHTSTIAAVPCQPQISKCWLCIQSHERLGHGSNLVEQCHDSSSWSSLIGIRTAFFDTRARVRCRI